MAYVDLINDLGELYFEAKNKEFSDFDGEKYDAPKMELVRQLTVIIDKTKNGQYDG